MFGALLLVFSAPAWSQEASLTGIVTDPDGAAVPDAKVTITQQGTGVVRTVNTGQDGRYIFPQLSPGTYKVEVQKENFKTAVRENVAVAVGTATTFDVALALGALTETMIVESETAGINTVDASLGTPFSGAQVSQLPSLNLDPSGLLSLQAGVAFVASQPDVPGGYSGISDFDGRSGSINGSRSDQTNITVDGVDANDPENGFAFASVIRVPQASLQEFRVSTQNYNADGGRSSAAQVQLVTRSGSNEIHGSAYYAHRNEIFNANDFFLNRAGVDRDKFRRHIFGVGLGGPVVKDRFFLWGNFEELRENLSTSALRAVPSNAFRDGVLIYSCADPDGPGPDNPMTPADVCPGGAVQGFQSMHSVDPGFYGLTPAELAAIDPLGIGPNLAANEHFRLYPTSNHPGTFDRQNIVGFIFSSPVNNNFKTWLLRADYNVDRNANHTVYWRGTLQDDGITSAGPQFPGLPESQTRLGNNRGMAVGYRSVFGANKVNTLRYGYTRIGETTAGQQNAAFINFRFISNLEDYASNTFGRIVPTHHIRDDFSWTRGRHTMTMGGDMRFTRNARFSNANSFHFFTHNPSWLPNVGRNLRPGAAECDRPGCFAVPAVSSAGGAAYNDSVVNLLGIITQASAFYNFDRTGATLPEGEAVRRRFAVNEYELYFQDQIRLTSTLTVTGGLRYVVISPPWETNGNQVMPTPNLNTWFETRRQLMLAGQPSNLAPQIQFALGGPVNGADHYYPYDWNNFSPRVGFAWAPRFREGVLGRMLGDGKTVFRGGWSLVYDRIGNALASSFDDAGSFGMSTSIDSLFGGCKEGPTAQGTAQLGTCPRFAGVFNTAVASTLLPGQGNTGTFPATPPGAGEEGSFAITTALDSGIITPTAHTYNFSIARELPSDFSIEVGYVGRSGRNLLMLRDLAMPADLCDPLGGQCYFEAAQELLRLADQGLSTTDIPQIGYWENIFPSFGPGGVNGGFLVCDIFGVDPDFEGGFSATQVAYDLMTCVHPDTTVFPFIVDLFGFPGFARGGPGAPDLDGDGIPDAPFALFDDQFATLTAWSSIARSEYHSLQVQLRKRMSRGFQFDLNYTLAKSLDHSSTPERAPTAFGFFTGGYSGSTINAWELDQEYSFSDFDMRHQLNANFIVEMPFGRGRAWANTSNVLDYIIGGWNFSGIVRVNSGLPANVINARVWPTNWNLQGNATCGPRFGGNPFGENNTVTAACPATQNVKNATGDRGPNLFADPDSAFERFRFTLPGQRGQRNILRADNYFNLDMALSKTFRMPWEGHSLALRWEAFNVTNSVFFDAVSLSASIGSQGTFGDYNGVMGGPRRMQISARYDF